MGLDESVAFEETGGDGGEGGQDSGEGAGEAEEAKVVD